jgi:transporter family-2 protein
VIGAGITWTVIKSVEMLGPAKSALLIVTAQLFVSYMIELFGLFGMDKAPFEFRKLVGLGVAVVGITIFQWK